MESMTAFDPNTRVSGKFARAFLENLKSEEFYHILVFHQLASIDPEAWYPQTQVLECLKDIAYGTEGGMMNLVAFGMKVIDTALQDQLSVEGMTIEEGLISFNDYYQMNHADGYAGDISVVVMGPKHVELVSYTPYPDDAEFGMIYGLSRKVAPAGAHPIVKHLDNTECRKKGGQSCTYEITW